MPLLLRSFNLYTLIAVVIVIGLDHDVIDVTDRGLVTEDAQVIGPRLKDTKEADLSELPPGKGKAAE